MAVVGQGPSSRREPTHFSMVTRSLCLKHENQTKNANFTSLPKTPRQSAILLQSLKPYFRHSVTIQFLKDRSTQDEQYFKLVRDLDGTLSTENPKRLYRRYEHTVSFNRINLTRRTFPFVNEFQAMAKNVGQDGKEKHQAKMAYHMPSHLVNYCRTAENKSSQGDIIKDAGTNTFGSSQPGNAAQTGQEGHLLCYSASVENTELIHQRDNCLLNKKSTVRSISQPSMTSQTKKNNSVRCSLEEDNLGEKVSENCGIPQEEISSQSLKQLKKTSQFIKMDNFDIESCLPPLTNLSNVGDDNAQLSIRSPIDKRRLFKLQSRESATPQLPENPISPECMSPQIIKISPRKKELAVRLVCKKECKRRIRSHKMFAPPPSPAVSNKYISCTAGPEYHGTFLKPRSVLFLE